MTSLTIKESITKKVGIFTLLFLISAVSIPLFDLPGILGIGLIFAAIMMYIWTIYTLIDFMVVSGEARAIELLAKDDKTNEDREELEMLLRLFNLCRPVSDMIPKDVKHYQLSRLREATETMQQ